MPRLRENQAPSYRLHKQSGQAIVTFKGRDVLLGPFGSPQSRATYDRLVAQWFQSGRQTPGHEPEGPTVAEIIAAFWKHAQHYYRYPNGSETSEVDNFRQVLRPLRRLYGPTPAAEFGPKALKTVREEMVKLQWARTNINRQVNRLKHVFKWATEEELVPPSVYHGLQTVAGLRAGRSEARETEPVSPVAEEYVRAVLPHVSYVIAAMIELQLISGMRPGEVCAMRACDLDMTGPLWLYRPSQHKTLHHGHSREIYLGPKAQALLRPFLVPDLQAHLFCPQAAVAERREKDHLRRTTPLCHGNRPGTHRQKRPQRVPGKAYEVDAYRRAIARGCDRAFPPPEAFLAPERTAQLRAWRAAHRWHPHQLRHTAATTLRREYGLEAAQVILGHRTLTVTQVYAEKNVQAARKLMMAIG